MHYSFRQTVIRILDYGIQTLTVPLSTVTLNPAYRFQFRQTATVLCRIADRIYETQACVVTLNPALVFNLGKLPVDAAIHALIFRQVNRILDLIQAQVPLSTHTKSSSRFQSRQTAC